MTSLASLRSGQKNSLQTSYGQFGKPAKTSQPS